jgi:cytochrome c-type biogenesis protein CcmF
VLLVVACAAVLLGTIYPLVIDALNLGKLSVGPQYFNAVFVPLMVPLLVIMVPGTVVRWRESNWGELLLRLRWVALAALGVGLAAPALAGEWSIGAAFGFFLAAWVVLGSVQHMVLRWRQPGQIGAAYWGMQCAHIGLAVVVAGITGVKSYEVERDVRMGVGDTVQIENYSFELMGVSEVNGPNYKALRGEVVVNKDEKLLEVLYPEKRRYFSSNMPMTEAAIDSGFFRDLYVSLGEPIEGERPQWSVRVYYKPFVSWLWYGSILMVLGGLLAVSDRRYRKSPAAVAA